MRLFVIFTMCILLCAGVAFGQAGGIGLYPDAAYMSCDYTDDTAALVPIYVVHKYTPGATAAQFMVVPGGGFNCTYTGEYTSMPTSIGTTQTGISVAYGACLSSDILLVTINYFCQGISPTCSYLEVVPDPGAPTGTIEVVDCTYQKHTALGGSVAFNADETCMCLLDYPFATKATSWGRVKVLYH